MAKRRRSYSERMIRQGARDFLSSNWRLLATFGLFMLIIAGIVVAWYVIVVGGQRGAFLAGLTVGSLSTAAVAVGLWLWLVFGDGYSFIVGKEGEKATREVLAEAVKDGTIFGWVDNIELGGGDVDHAAVAPNGVLVIETKYWKREVRAGDVDRWVTQAHRAAKTTRTILLSAEIKSRQETRPLVAVWGAAKGLEAASGGQYGEYVIRGPDLAGWLSVRSGGELPQELGLELVGKLEAFARRYPPTESRLGGGDGSGAGRRMR